VPDGPVRQALPETIENGRSLRDRAEACFDNLVSATAAIRAATDAVVSAQKRASPDVDRFWRSWATSELCLEVALAPASIDSVT